MTKANKDIRQAISEAGLTQWQVAYELNVSAQTIYNWLRVPLDDDHRERITNAINELKGELQNA